MGDEVNITALIDAYKQHGRHLNACEMFSKPNSGSPRCVMCKASEECATEKGLVDTPIFGLLPTRIVERHNDMTTLKVIPGRWVRMKGKRGQEFDKFYATGEWKAFEREAMGWICHRQPSEEELRSMEPVQTEFPGAVPEGVPF